LISGGGTNLQAVIDACESGKITGKVVFVGSDNFDAKGLKRAEKHNIPFFVVDYASFIKNYNDDPAGFSFPDDFDFNSIIQKQTLMLLDADLKKLKSFFCTRATIEAKLLEKMASFEFDLLILAGFMRNLTPYFIDKLNKDPYHPRIMNIHPALLPAFPGTDGYGDTFRYGCKVGGCTVHFVDYGEDSGPIIGQKAFEIYPDDTIDAIKDRGLKMEWQLYPECIQLFAENRLKLERQIYELGKGKKIERTVVKILP
jgi:phosphoribosylglycinamide formyltransferase-1